MRSVMKVFRLHRVLLALILGVLFAGCGYLPASKQAREVLGEKIFVEVTVSLENPESAVLIKDATRKAVITRFHASLVPQKMAETTLWVDLANVSFVPLQYDSNGYVIVYRTAVILNVTRRGNGEKKSYNAQGFYDFAIEPNAVITDTQRFEAIRYASLKALNSFVAKVGAEGSKAAE